MPSFLCITHFVSYIKFSLVSNIYIVDNIELGIMKITIDTKSDSKEEMQHAIDLLQRLIGSSSGKMTNSSNSNTEFNADMGAMAGFANMMGNTEAAPESPKPQVEEEKTEEESDTPSVQLY